MPGIASLKGKERAPPSTVHEETESVVWSDSEENMGIPDEVESADSILDRQVAMVEA
jgi:hypothetical protein